MSSVLNVIDVKQENPRLFDLYMYNPALTPAIGEYGQAARLPNVMYMYKIILLCVLQPSQARRCR